MRSEISLVARWHRHRTSMSPMNPATRSTPPGKLSKNRRSKNRLARSQIYRKQRCSSDMRRHEGSPPDHAAPASHTPDLTSTGSPARALLTPPERAVQAQPMTPAHPVCLHCLRPLCRSKAPQRPTEQVTRARHRSARSNSPRRSHTTWPFLESAHATTCAAANSEVRVSGYQRPRLRPSRRSGCEHCADSPPGEPARGEKPRLCAPTRQLRAHQAAGKIPSPLSSVAGTQVG